MEPRRDRSTHKISDRSPCVIEGRTAGILKIRAIPQHERQCTFNLRGSLVMIEIQDLHKSFNSAGKRVIAVDGVSFSARDGEITGLLGPNGAGKTTTLRCLYTLMQPERGKILVD